MVSNPIARSGVMGRIIFWPLYLSVDLEETRTGDTAVLHKRWVECLTSSGFDRNRGWLFEMNLVEFIATLETSAKTNP